MRKVVLHERLNHQCNRNHQGRVDCKHTANYLEKCVRKYRACIYNICAHVACAKLLSHEREVKDRKKKSKHATRDEISRDLNINPFLIHFLILKKKNWFLRLGRSIKIPFSLKMSGETMVHFLCIFSWHFPRLYNWYLLAYRP